jgi:hypothetical protein
MLTDSMLYVVLSNRNIILVQLSIWSIDLCLTSIIIIESSGVLYLGQ